MQLSPLASLKEKFEQAEFRIGYFTVCPGKETVVDL